MKYLLISTLLLISGMASAKSFRELEGRYKLKLLIFTSELELNSSGHTILTFGNTICEGQSIIIGDTISAPFECNNGQAATIAIDLKNVHSYSKFRAPVTFPGVAPVNCLFRKIQ